MDQIRTGSLIRRLRLAHGMTQLALAERLCVSDKAVSKWERGCGAPDISILPRLAEALGVSAETLLRGDMEENDMNNGDMRKLRFYVCPDCGNLLVSADEAAVTCCGKRLAPLDPKRPDEENALCAEQNDGGWFVTSAHPMERGHYISFAALLTADTLVVRKLYPEWGLETRLPYFRRCTLLWYCTRDGLFAQELRA